MEQAMVPLSCDLWFSVVNTTRKLDEVPVGIQQEWWESIRIRIRIIGKACITSRNSREGTFIHPVAMS